jgi:hypothetical protein
MSINYTIITSTYHLNNKLGTNRLTASETVPQSPPIQWRSSPGTILQGPEQSLLLRSLDPAFKVAPAQCLILGLVRQQNGAGVQRKTNAISMPYSRKLS